MARSPKTPPIPDGLRLVLNRLETRGPVRTRAMFGGHGVWCDGRFVAVVHVGTLYLKADSETRPEFEAAGMRPFQPFPGRPPILGFYPLPPGDDDSLDHWLDSAIAAARRAR